MRISIVTPSFNQAPYIEETIRSVQEQDHDDIEHIVVDGGSKDGTVAILERYPHLRWISERDEGQTDALNKGIAMSSGDVVGWINSDDYYDRDVFGEVSRLFKEPEVQWVIGGVTLRVDPRGVYIPRKIVPISFESLSSNPDILCQQGVFFRRSFLDSAGPFDKDLHLVMDLEMWLRLSRLSAPLMVGRNYAFFRLHVDQKTRGPHVLKQLSEMKTVFRRYGVGERHILKLTLKKWMIYLKVQLLAAVGKN